MSPTSKNTTSDTAPEHTDTPMDRRRRGTDALLDRIDALQDFYDYSPVGYLTLDKRGRILEVNLTAVIMLKVVKSELIGQSLFAHVDRKDRDILYLHLRRLFKNKKPLSCRIQIRNDNHETIHASLDSIYAKDRKGRRICRTVMVDITEHIRSEKALLEQKEQLRIAVKSGRLSTWDRDLVTGAITWNAYLYEQLGRDPDGPAITGETFFAYIHPDDIGRVRENLADTLSTGKHFIDEFRIIREDGQVRWLAASGRVYRDPDGRPVRMAGVNFDITDRKELEQAIQKSHEKLEIRVRERTADLQKKTDELEELNAQLQCLNEKIIQEHGKRMFLSRRLVEILEKERRDTAMALHDEAGQLLTMLKMDLELMERVGNEQKQTKLLHSAKEKTFELIRIVKNVSRQLRPSVLDTLGLLPAVRSLIDQVKTYQDGIDIVFSTRSIPDQMEPAKETALYRILQEALNNCIKYAHPKRIHISLFNRKRVIMLTVEDDGKGFDYESVSARSAAGKGPMGISIMRERAEQLGGTFRIESTPGRGTFITVEIPV